MDKVKTRKQGNALMVTIAKKFNVPEGQEFYITQEEDGTISLIPKVKDYFEGVEKNAFVDEEDSLATNYKPVGSELDE